MKKLASAQNSSPSDGNAEPRGDVQQQRPAVRVRRKARQTAADRFAGMANENEEEWSTGAKLVIEVKKNIAWQFVRLTDSILKLFYAFIIERVIVLFRNYSFWFEDTMNSEVDWTPITSCIKVTLNFNRGSV